MSRQTPARRRICLCRGWDTHAPTLLRSGGRDEADGLHLGATSKLGTKGPLEGQFVKPLGLNGCTEERVFSSRPILSHLPSAAAGCQETQGIGELTQNRAVWVSALAIVACPLALPLPVFALRFAKVL